MFKNIVDLPHPPSTLAAYEHAAIAKRPHDEYGHNGIFKRRSYLPIHYGLSRRFTRLSNMPCLCVYCFDDDAETPGERAMDYI